jgi:hypothetical protein
MYMRRVLFRAAAAIAVTGAVVLLVPADGAQARPPAIYGYDASTANDATPMKELLVTCPDPEDEVLSGGAYVVGGGRRVHIVRSQPSPSQTGWIAAAQLGPGRQDVGRWQLHVYVKCGHHVLMNLGFVGDTEFVTFHTPANSNTTNEITAPCPADRVVVSVGGRISGGDGAVVLHTMTVDPDTNSVRVRGVEVEGGTAQAWSVWAFAVCAKASSLPAYEVVEQDTVSTTGDKGYTLECPDNMTLVGFGAANVDADGHARFTRLEPEQFAAAVESTVDETGAPAPWVLRVQAVCAFPYG